MVDSLSLIYSELWRLQIHDFRVTWRNDANSVDCNRHNSEYIRLIWSTMEIKVVYNASCSKIKKFDGSQINFVEKIYSFERGEGRYFTFFFKNPFLAHFSITFLSAIQFLVWYKNLSYFFAEYHRLETPLLTQSGVHIQKL